MSSSKISTSTALMIIILSTGLMNHVIVLPLLLDQAGRDAWISVLVAIPLNLLWLGILYYVMRKTEQQSLTLLIKQRYGNIAYLLIVIPLLLFFMAVTFITLKDITYMLSTNFLRVTPRYVIAISIMLLCSLTARAGIISISILSALILPFVCFFGILVMTANIPYKHYSWVLPVLQNGWGPVWKGSFYQAGGYIEMLFLLLFQQHIKHQVKLWHLVLVGLCLAGLTLGPALGAITEFGPQLAADQRYPAFEQWRLVEIGKYIEHLDFLSIYQWMSGTLIRISISLFLCIDVMNFKYKRTSNVTLWVITCAILVLVILPISDINFYAMVKNQYFTVFVPLIIFIALIFLLVSFRVQTKSR
ncbi:endospore germination permease [Paenibacillus sp. yr247]|uniref:GerAB/ArcD/ProY family transporter n=1 Tax=Paenibacillus sp. yr247 TaxID=1761880 RepID=UPI001C31364A|nr:endospore germination permease [Paenibacillus sp. yr247]